MPDSARRLGEHLVGRQPLDHHDDQQQHDSSGDPILDVGEEYAPRAAVMTSHSPPGLPEGHHRLEQHSPGERMESHTPEGNSWSENDVSPKGLSK